MKTVQQIARNQIARSWLKEHDLINIAKLCRRINYNRGAFSHFEENNLDLSEEAVARLEEELKKYGYQPPICL